MIVSSRINVMGNLFSLQSAPFLRYFWDSLQNPHLFLNLYFSINTNIAEKELMKDWKAFLSFFDKNQNPYWEEDGVEIFPERAGPAEDRQNGKL